MNGTQTEDLPAETLAHAEREINAGETQFLIALRRVTEQDYAIDPEAPVAAFGSAF